jgi:spore coat polysaccharide biosynthesis protein SpsF
MKELVGEPVLGHLLRRIGSVPSIWGLVVATTTSERDNVIEDYCHEFGVRSFRGSEEDVLDRYLECAESIGAETIVRVTSDCPLIEPNLLEFAVEVFMGEEGKVDYVSNVIPPTFPDGLDVEVFSFEALTRVWRDAVAAPEREHVTLHFWNNPDRYRMVNIMNPVDLSALRWTLDTPEDLILIQGIYEALHSATGGNFGMKEILEWLEDKWDSSDQVERFLRRQNSLSLDSLNRLLEGRNISSVMYQPVTMRGEEI